MADDASDNCLEQTVIARDARSESKDNTKMTSQEKLFLKEFNVKKRQLELDRMELEVEKKELELEKRALALEAKLSRISLSEENNASACESEHVVVRTVIDNVLDRVSVVGDECLYESSGERNSVERANPQVTNMNSTEEPPLTKRQIAARQVTGRDLPTFSGTTQQWAEFIDAYENSTAIGGYTDRENRLRLQKALKGPAKQAVEHLLLLQAKPSEIIILLKAEFGRPELIIDAQIERVRRMPAPKADKLETMASFGTAVRNMVAAITTSGISEYLYNVSLLKELSAKLPPTMRQDWALYKTKLSKVTLFEFGKWIGDIADALKQEIPPTLTYQFQQDGADRQKGRGVAQCNVHSTQATAAVCVLCKGTCVKLNNCRKFLEMNVAARWNLVRERKLCKRCLTSHRNWCRVRTPCGNGECRALHHNLLHEEKAGGINSNEQVSPTPVNTHSETDAKVLFRYVPVLVHGRNKSVRTYAFLDDGSSSTFIDQSLKEELELDGEPHPLHLEWTGNTTREEKNSELLRKVVISGVGDTAKRFELTKVHTLHDLALPVQTVSADLISSYPYLRSMPIIPYTNARPRILIGIDNYNLGKPMKIREGGKAEPVACKTRLGWTVFGSCSSTKHVPSSGISRSHVGLHICLCSGCDGNVNESIKKFFSIESLGISNPRQLMSAEDERAIKILADETNLKDGHYTTGLLWRHNVFGLPSNKEMAMRRHDCLKRKLNRDPALAKAVHEKMEYYELQGYIRRLSEQELAEKHPKEWYLPIFPVINPNKPGKIRMVFDAAAEVKGVSLNKMLLTGPDQLTSLLSVLFKFRENRVAVVGDIKEMFFQIRMKQEDQRSQLILWEKEHSTCGPEVYAVAVVTFGAACSPSTAQFIKNMNAERFKEKFPRAADCIKQEHYVDDMLMSVETEHEAITLVNQVRDIHAKGGFEIRNWLSNSRNVLTQLQQTQPSIADLDICLEQGTEKVLGMWWNTTADVFTFQVSSQMKKQLLSGEKLPSKREVLGTLMSVYDPMGLLGNFLMYLKILLQDIWRAGYDWEEEIRGILAEKWSRWIAALPNVKSVRIPRCYRLSTSAETANVQLHIFCDASENGMAAVAYLRFNEGEKIECAIVGSKTRVAPLKYLSIPRLELQAAVIGGRFASTILQMHRIKIHRVFYWTDSRDVICWLRSDHRKYSQFVACRTGEILETSNVDDWRWISTKENVADEGTKWTKIPDMSPSSRWFHGPDFLWEPEERWPLSVNNPEETVEEIRKHVHHHTVTQPLICFERFSSWKTMQRTIGYVFRFKDNISNQTNQKMTTKPLNQNELLRAERLIISEIQQSAFANEIRSLKENSFNTCWKRVIGKNSLLYKLSPVIGDDGLLRVRGRFANCPWIDGTVKQPIILPRTHAGTDLLIMHYHIKYKHCNHATIINEIRAKYYIPRIRSEYKRVRKTCQYCKIDLALPEPPSMGDIPHQRLAIHQRPFSYTGIDYFGPISVVVGRRVEKRWGVIFTCLTTRAIHLEVAHSLNTSSCILAIRRFMARRGSPLEIISDCGTNFIGTSRELAAAANKVDQNTLMEEFCTAELKWTFNPPSAPHFGGCWERLIQSVKKVLGHFNLPRLPSDEVLQSALTEIEMMINARPLTYVPLDGELDEPVTPNHLLLGSSTGIKPNLPLDDSPVSVKNSWKASQIIADQFWRRWTSDYLPTLTRKTKWFQPVRPIKEGDIVVIVDGNLPRNSWPKGRVATVVRAKDGQVRRATVQTAHGMLERPASKLAVLDVSARHELRQ